MQGCTGCAAAAARLSEPLLLLPPPLLQVPKDDSKRVITFANSNDYIAFRHHTYSKPAGTKSITLTECGPR
jgi:U3 small nucleolar ribonucleoprotein protein IMP4